MQAPATQSLSSSRYLIRDNHAFFTDLRPLGIVPHSHTATTVSNNRQAL